MQKKKPALSMVVQGDKGESTILACARHTAKRSRGMFIKSSNSQQLAEYRDKHQNCTV